MTNATKEVKENRLETRSLAKLRIENTLLKSLLLLHFVLQTAHSQLPAPNPLPAHRPFLRVCIPSFSSNYILAQKRIRDTQKILLLTESLTFSHEKKSHARVSPRTTTTSQGLGGRKEPKIGEE